MLIAGTKYHYVFVAVTFLADTEYFNEACSGSRDICLHSYVKDSIRKFCEMCVNYPLIEALLQNS